MSASSLQESTKASSSDASCVPETLFELTHAGGYTLGVVDGSRPGCIASSSWAEAASWLASEDEPAEAEEWCGDHNTTGESGGALLRAWYHVRRHRRVKTRKSEAGRLDKASAEVAIVTSTKSRQVEATLRPGVVEVHVAAAAVPGKKGGGGGGGGGAGGPCFSPFSALLPTSLLPATDLYGERPVHATCALVSPSAAARAKLRPHEAVFALEDGPTLPNEVLTLTRTRTLTLRHRRAETETSAKKTNTYADIN